MDLIRDFLYRYYSDNNCCVDKIFTDNCKQNKCKITKVSKENIILNGDEIEICLSNQLNNSADRIIISSQGRKLSIIVCELSKGKRDPDLIKRKIENTSNHIVDILKDSEFEILHFRCCYVGQYEDLYKGVMKKKSPVVRISNLNSHNIMINRFDCGVSFDKVSV